MNLFIYIPTFNRPNLLRAQLQALCPQALAHGNKIRILVRDNASDNTAFDKIKSDFKAANIFFESNFGNIGGNANISLGFVFAKQDEFIWILSDNDILRDDCIDGILSCLDSKYDFVFFSDKHSDPSVINLSFEDGWDVPFQLGQGLISYALYNSSTIRDSTSFAFYFHNSSFPHVAVALASLKSKQKLKALALPRADIFAHSLLATEQPADYRLSYLGMPLLISLLSPKYAKSFAKSWLDKRGYLFYANKAYDPALFLSSRYLLFKYCKLSAYPLALKASILSYVYPLAHYLYAFCSKSLSQSATLFLRRLARLIGYS